MSSDREDKQKSTEKQKQCSKTLQRIAKNIAPYLNEPKPDKNKLVRQPNDFFLCGHSDSVEDLCFKPGSADILCSVGIDRQLLIWDLRVSTSEPKMSLKDLHSSDINTVDWSPCNESLIATGGNDNLVKIVDLRKFSTNSLTNAAGL